MAQSPETTAAPDIALEPRLLWQGKQLIRVAQAVSGIFICRDSLQIFFAN